MLWLLLLLLTLVVLLYWLSIRPFKYWTKRGVPQGRPVPILGDNWGPFLGKMSFADMILYIYNMCPGTKVSGMYQMMEPTLVLKDPQIIKQITVKDFDHFQDHRLLVPDDTDDPLWTNNLFVMRGEKWREMRSTISPAFTSSKMKFMFGLMNEIAQQFTEYFVQKPDGATITVELKETFTRYTTDVIASTAFGVKCDSLKDPDNDFYTMGRNATDFTGFWKYAKFLAFFISPKLSKVLKIKLFDESVTQFFLALIKNNIFEREKHGIVRPDLIQLLMEARKDLKKEDNASRNEDQIKNSVAVIAETKTSTKLLSNLDFSDENITAQAMVFFFAGFESVSSLLCFMAYELGVNLDIQTKLFREIEENFKKCDGVLTYQTLLGMKYLDMVVSETLRKWPNAIGVDRVCTKPYTLNLNDSPTLQIDVGTVLCLPIFGIHRDPKFYPEPDRFDPDRFSDQNRTKIDPYTYLPFGIGPRNCIGSRFAVLETKALFYYLVKSFEIVPVARSTIPLVLTKKGFTLNSEGGFWFGFKRR